MIEKRNGLLSGKDRRILRAIAHGRKPLIRVGEAGISDAVVSALEAALKDHELVKVKLQQPSNKKQAAQILAERTHAHLCGVVQVREWDRSDT